MFRYWDDLRLLVTLRDSESLAEAAARLYRSPSALSHALRRLEKELGYRLVDRRGYRLQLTSAGKLWASQAGELVNAASHVARQAERLAQGWESELQIAVSDLLPLPPLFALLKRYYDQIPTVGLRVTREVLSGGWDALLAGRADLALGVPLDGRPDADVCIRSMGEIAFVFVCAIQHPLAKAVDPLYEDDLRRYRSVAAADTTQGLPARSLRILPGQRVLTVPDQVAKYQAIREGLGVGFLPAPLAKEGIDAGDFASPQLGISAPATHRLCYAWRKGETGKSLQRLLDLFANHRDFGFYLTS